MRPPGRSRNRIKSTASTGTDLPRRASSRRAPSRRRGSSVSTLRPASIQSDSNENHHNSFSPSSNMRRIITGETVQLHPIAEISQRPNWRAGIEPGLDPTKENGGLPSLPTPPTPCVITAVDFDQENISINDLTNDSLHNYLAGDRGKPSICRWINVSGLDWDVIQTIALKYDLSHLALEDLLNTKSRTKVEW